ncbi:glycosyltransferase family 4 protein [Leptolyngbya ohadii]|uniref:glycosyltransferase family 4 protein n=1 Tax=Leptolyngbya ohadii TaxID=1962290 RepID=UPI000B59D746|nr:glycosyltransferase family 4 protein [Leptolyngbya ohadii]
MRVLILHNRYRITSGEEAVVRAEQALLEARGHAVEVLEVDNSEIDGTLGKVKTAINVIYSQSSKKLVGDAISKFKPEVVHVHNFFPLLSPSVYFACNEAGIPIVQTLHNYRVLCAIASFYRDGRICEDCLGQPFGWSGVIHKCYRGSSIGSAAVSAMSSIHRWIGTWKERVDAYICLTEFSRQKFVQGGIPADKLFVKPNFVYPPSLSSEKSIDLDQNPYAVYVGRLYQEKGIGTLLEAWKRLDGKIKLKIVGDGPLAQQVKEETQYVSNVELLGKQPPELVNQLMANAQFVVVPSEWYETFGLVVIESFSVGTPVIASKIGALAELIDDGRNGLHFSPGDAEDLAVKIKWVLDNPDKLARMRQSSYNEFKVKYDAERNYEKLIGIYQNAINSKGRIRDV